MASDVSPLPITILSGFLGAGKTTLLKRILAATNRHRVLVLENELGALPVDDELMAEAGPGRLATVMGRTCCEARTEFIELLHEMTRGTEHYDRLVIETTGVAHPGMVAHAMLSDPLLRRHFQIDGIVTVVDAAHFAEHAGGDGHAKEQVAYADAVVVNKIDLVTPEALAETLASLRQINRDALYLTAEEARVPVDKLLALGGFDLAHVEKSMNDCRSHGRKTGEASPAHEHEIETMSIELPGLLGLSRFQQWIEQYVVTHAENIFRAKGIVAIANVSERLVFQGVHWRFRCTLGRPWGKTEPLTRMVFIGRNLDRTAILQSLSACSPETEP